MINQPITVPLLQQAAALEQEAHHIAAKRVRSAGALTCAGSVEALTAAVLANPLMMGPPLPAVIAWAERALAEAHTDWRRFHSSRDARDISQPTRSELLASATHTNASLTIGERQERQQARRQDAIERSRRAGIVQRGGTLNEKRLRIVLAWRNDTIDERESRVEILPLRNAAGGVID